MNRKAFQEAHPGVFFLDPADLPGLSAFLDDAPGRLTPGARVLGAAKAGEGNMNCVVRVQTSAGTFILKQARDWVEKYPALSAPRDRALVEERFYALVAGVPAVAGRMPRLLWADVDARLLALEDLGAARDFFPLYDGSLTLDPGTLDELAGFLAALHRVRAPTDDPVLSNHAMRALNHTHIFALPMQADNPLDLDRFTPGLGGAAASLKADAAYAVAVAALGARYLSGDGKTLLHGDFFPGSWLRTATGATRVIDPEFCFRGDAEFDVGVTLAHLSLADQPPASTRAFLARYRAGAPTTFDPALADRYAGVEIMRRLLGVAQIPTLPADLARKRRLLDLSRQLVLGHR